MSAAVTLSRSSGVDLSDREVRLEAGRIAAECAEAVGVSVHAMLRGESQRSAGARDRLCERLRAIGWLPKDIGAHFAIAPVFASALPKAVPVPVAPASQTVPRQPRARHLDAWPTALASARPPVEEVEESEEARPAGENCGARARLALRRTLLRAGYEVSLVTVHCWSRGQQGVAYQWAVAFLGGREDLLAPQWVKDGETR